MQKSLKRRGNPRLIRSSIYIYIGICIWTHYEKIKRWTNPRWTFFFLYFFKKSILSSTSYTDFTYPKNETLSANEIPPSNSNESMSNNDRTVQLPTDLWALEFSTGQWYLGQLLNRFLNLFVIKPWRKRKFWNRIKNFDWKQFSKVLYNKDFFIMYYEVCQW